MKLAIEYNGEEAGILIYHIGKNSKNKIIGCINYINILEEYRGKGLAKALLWHLYDIMLNEKIRNIEFDDCSDLYRDKNNIYIKLGAKYIENSGPEMVWKIWTKYVKKLRYEYDNSNTNIYIIKKI
jgi:ribosomal protein S18 acetylase RimI-like enzyme